MKAFIDDDWTGWNDERHAAWIEQQVIRLGGDASATASPGIQAERLIGKRAPRRAAALECCGPPQLFVSRARSS